MPNYITAYKRGFWSSLLPVFIGFFILFSTKPVYATANPVMSFQGKIIDKNTGINPAPSCVIAGSGNDSCDFRASIYSDPVGGTLLWREQHLNKEIGATNNVFDLQLNSICSSWTTPIGSCSGTGFTWGVDNTIYLQIEFDIDGNGDFSGAELFSRKLISSVPYAFNADTAESANSITGGLDTVYANDSDKIINVDNAAGLGFNSSSIGNINFNLQSTGDFVVQTGGNNALVINDNGTVNIGNSLLGSRVQIGEGTGSSTPSTLVLDIKNTAGDPTGTNGAIYYNSTTNQFRCHQNGAWATCATSANGFVQGGNSFGTTATLGTTDANSLAIITNGVTRATFNTTSDLVLNSAGSTDPNVFAELLFTGTAGTGDLRIGADGGDILWQGGGSRNLQMGAYHGIDLLGGRATAGFPTFQAGTLIAYNTRILNSNNSIGLVIQGVGGQTTNLMELRNSSGTGLSAFTSVGNLALGTITSDARATFVQVDSTTSSNNLVISYTQSTNAANLLGAGIVINTIASGDAGDTIRAINIANTTANGSTQQAINIGTGFDQVINLNGANETIGIANNSTLNFSDGTNNLAIFRDASTNFGAYLETGALVSRNSYVGEEFSRERGALTTDGNQVWGDFQQFGVDENTVCTFNIVDDVVNGIGQMSNNAANSSCLAYHSSAIGNAHLQFDADNLPLLIMKVRPSAASIGDDTFVGIGTQVTASNTDPTSGIYFTNNNGTTWTGVTRNAGVSTNVVCTGATISTTQFALLKIEVISNTSVNFYVDPDVSNGVDWTSCGTSTTNIPTAGLTSMLQWSSTVANRFLDIDFYRVWQDDSIIPLNETTALSFSDNEDLVMPISTGPADTADIVAGNFEDFIQVADPVSYPNLIANTITADKIRANSIEGMEILTDNLGSLTNKYQNLEEKVSGIAATPTTGFKQLQIESAQITLDLQVLGQMLVKGNLIIEGPAQFNQQVVFASLAKFQDTVSFSKSPEFNNSTGGYATIKPGDQEVRVEFNQKFATTPIISASSRDHTAAYTLVGQSANGFTIKLAVRATTELSFSWLAFRVDNPLTSVSKQTERPKPDIANTPIANEPPQKPATTPVMSSPVDLSSQQVNIDSNPASN
jgi:hypothetical protein